MIAEEIRLAAPKRVHAIEDLVEELSGVLLEKIYEDETDELNAATLDAIVKLMHLEGSLAALRSEIAMKHRLRDA